MDSKRGKVAIIGGRNTGKAAFAQLELLEELQEYKRLEGQGLLLKLPFAIGTPIYKVCYASEANIGFIYESIMSLKFYADNIRNFEKGLVYANKSEAEQALAEMKGE